MPLVAKTIYLVMVVVASDIITVGNLGTVISTAGQGEKFEINRDQ